MSIITLNVAEVGSNMRVDYTNANAILTQGVADGSTLNIKPGGGSVGVVYSGSVVINNIGNQNLTITSVNIVSGDTLKYNVTPLTILPWTISPSSNQGFTIEFLGDLNPVVGTYSVVVQIVHDATNETTPFELEFEITVS